MKTKKMILPMVCCIPFLGSCTSPQTTSSQTWGVNPVYSINQTSDSPDALYQLGRYYQGQQRYEQAAAAYHRALAANPDFVEARNGLGVIYAMQGRHEDAIAAFRIAISKAPDAAHLHNNLGHALYLQGSYNEAVSALEQATKLDPGNQRALSNLGLASAKANESGSVPSVTVAATTAQDNTTQAVATLPIEPAALAQDARQPDSSTKLAAIPPAQAKNRLETIQVAENVYELREQIKPVQMATAMANAQPTDTPVKPAKLRLEVSNGNGMTGFARKVSGYLGQQGYPASRLTNQKPFQVAVSQIQYRPGYRDQALSLKSSLPDKPDLELVQSSKLRADIQARLLLGKDLSQRAAQFESGDRTILVASNAPGPDKAESTTK